MSTLFLFSPPLFFTPKSQTFLPTPTTTITLFPATVKLKSSIIISKPSKKHLPFIVKAKDSDVDADDGGPDEYDMEEEEAEDVDNKRDYDVEYEPGAAHGGGGGDDIAGIDNKSFVWMLEQCTNNYRQNYAATKTCCSFNGDHLAEHNILIKRAAINSS